MVVELGSDVLLANGQITGRVIKYTLVYGSSMPTYTVEYWLDGNLRTVELYEDEINAG